MSREEDRAWAELIDSFNAPTVSGDAPGSWPESENIDPDERPPDDGPADDYRDASITFESPDDAEPPASSSLGDDTPSDHFVPPTPAPIPHGDPITRFAWAGVIAGPAILIIVTALSWTPPRIIAMLAVGGFIGGFITLIARLRGHHPDDPDNGAVL